MEELYLLDGQIDHGVTRRGIPHFMPVIRLYFDPRLAVPPSPAYVEMHYLTIPVPGSPHTLITRLPGPVHVDSDVDGMVMRPMFRTVARTIVMPRLRTIVAFLFLDDDATLRIMITMPFTLLNLLPRFLRTAPVVIAARAFLPSFACSGFILTGPGGPGRAGIGLYAAAGAPPAALPGLRLAGCRQRQPQHQTCGHHQTGKGGS
ncbi:MAG: hypothetical protein D6746_16635 [Bacteroidetes bacterium]|nr:MAG: hypothetical protein D6746_16635 [Bacteroidota bacterium]